MSQTQTQAFKLLRTSTYYSTLQAACDAAIDGDTITITPGTYTGVGSGRRVSIRKSLTIKSAVQGTKAVLDAEFLEGPGGNAILWINDGVQSVTLEDLHVRNIKANGSYNPGITTLGNTGSITLRRCKIEECNNGWLSSSGDTTCNLTFENCEFVNNGIDDGYTHQLYVGAIQSFTMRGCWSHNTKTRDDYNAQYGAGNSWRESWGHLVKSRAKITLIEGCRLTMEVQSSVGGANRCIDIPNGGDLTVRGCVAEFRTKQNNGAGAGCFVEWGGEGTNGFPGLVFDGRSFNVRIQQNTVVARSDPNGDPNKDAFAIWIGNGVVWPGSSQATPVPTVQTVQDNVFCGWRDNPVAMLTGPPPYTYTNVGAANNTCGALSLLTDYTTYDYRPVTAVAGVQNWSTVAYAHPLSTVTRTDAYRGGAIPGDGTTWVYNPNQYKGNQTFTTVSNTAATISPAGGWKYLGEELGAGQPSTKLRDVYKTSQYLDQQVAPQGIYRQDQLTADANNQFNVWQTAAWNGYGFFYQSAGGHLTGYVQDLLMLRVADPVGVYRLYEPQPPTAVVRKAGASPNPAGVGDNCYIGSSFWSQYPTGTATPLFSWGPHPEHHYMGMVWDAANEKLVVGTDQQVCTTDTVFTQGVLANFRASVNVFNPYAATPKQAWTRILAPSTYAPSKRTFIGGVQNADGTVAFRSVASDYFTAKVDANAGTMVSPAGVTGYPNNGSFGSMFRDPATNIYYEITSSSYLNTTGSLWNRTSGAKVCDLPCYLGASGANYDDNHPAGLIIGGYLYLFGHPSAGNSGTDTAPLAAWRVNLSTGAIDTFNDGFTVTGGGVNDTSLTMNGFHGRIGYISTATPKCFVLQVSPMHNALVFRPPTGWGL
jgi:hypothetical protein